MKKTHEPLVSVVTPFYNGEPYLKECIESVLNQSYENFEYILVDNFSKDDSHETAERYGKKDPRIRIIRPQEFLNQVKNYNFSLRRISAESIYCKVVAADDRIFPTCLEKMVAIAESNPGVGVVSAYTLMDWGSRSDVYLTGLPYQQTCFSGKEICRRFLKEGLYVFGSPTATLIRSEIVRERNPFYYEESVTEDVDPFFEILPSWDFGFVPEILTYTRRHNDSTISALKGISLMQLTKIVEIAKYGKDFLNEREYAKARREIKKDYYQTLGRSMLRLRPKAFWDFHRRGLRFAGIPMSSAGLVFCAVSAGLDLLLNPKNTVESLVRKLTGSK